MRASTLRINVLTATLVLMLSGVPVAEPVWVPAGDVVSPQKPQSSLLNSDGNSTTVEFTVSGFWSADSTVDGASYQFLSFRDFSTTTDVGKAQLPVLRRLIAIPNNVNVNVEIVDHQTVTLPGYTIYPYQKPLPIGENRAKLDIDEGFYARNALYPSVSAEVSPPGIWRDLRVVTLQVNPISYNPASGEVRVSTSMTVRLTYSGISTVNVKTPSGRPIADNYDAMYRRTVLNYETLGLPVEDAVSLPIASSSGDYDYLIISADQFADNLAPFVSWKTSQGLSCRVALVSQVGSTVDSIKNYITQEYNSAGIRYVLLVGDSYHIPGYSGYDGIDFSDYYYMLVEGDDNFPDMAVGRFSVEDTIHVNNIVSKTVTFEANPPPGDWLENVLLVEHRYNAGFSDHIVAATYTATGTYSYLYPNFTKLYGYPVDSGGTDATNADLFAALNAGHLLVNYIGHGSPSCWVTWSLLEEYFCFNGVDTLSNGQMTPIVISNACYTGNLAHVPCLGETFTRSPQGAVAFRGATTVDGWLGVPIFAHRFMSTLFDDGCFPRIGDAFSQTYVDMLVYYEPDKRSLWMNLLFGDPSLVILYDREPRSRTVWVDCNTGNDTTGDGTKLSPLYSIGKAVTWAAERHYDSILVEFGIYTGAGNRNMTISYIPEKGELVIMPASDTSHPVIDCQGGGRAFAISTGALAKIAGFTIINGNGESPLPCGDGGGGIKINGAAVTVENCEFRNCSAGNYPDVPAGGALSIAASSSASPATVAVKNCQFIDNYASPASSYGGGAVSIYGLVEATFDSCVFEGNSVAWCNRGGGALSVNSGADVTFKTCLFLENSVTDGTYDRGGAIYVSGGLEVTAENCTFAGNQAEQGAVWYLSEAKSPQLNFDRNIFSNNSGGPAFYSNHTSASYSFMCNLFWQNTELFGGYVDSTCLGSDNLFEDPLFCKPESDIYTLIWMSPCTEDNSPCSEQIGAYGVCSFAIDPLANELNVPVTADISITFGYDMDETTINDTTFLVEGRLTGKYDGSYIYNGFSRTATFQPSGDLVFGDVVTAYVTDALKTVSDSSLYEYAWSFTVAVDGGSAEFDDETVYATDDKPQSVLSADLDGDGDLDLVSANTTSSNVTVFLNKGIGLFGSRAEYKTGKSPVAVVAADVNRDGDLDLITANNSKNPSVSILHNDGNGDFGAYHADCSSGLAPRSVCAADLNNDGHLDFASACSGEDRVAVYLNNGDGSFGAYVGYVTGADPYSVAAGDLDNDGDIDLVTANYGQNGIGVLPNNGAGGFESWHAFASGGVRPHAVTTADVNEDGFLDIVVANSGSGDIGVIYNDGSGSLSGAFHSLLTFGVGKTPKSVCVGDLDGDGHLDVAAANSMSNDVSILVGNGDGTFVDGSVFSVGAGPMAIFAADFNGDGGLDLTTANSMDDNVSILTDGCCVGLRGNVDNDPTDLCCLRDLQYLIYYLSGGPAPECMDEADVDGSGRIDMSDVNYLTNYLFWQGPAPVPCP